MFWFMATVVFVSLFEAYADKTTTGYAAGVRFRWYRQLLGLVGGLRSSAAATPAAVAQPQQAKAEPVRNGAAVRDPEEIPI